MRIRRLLPLVLLAAGCATGAPMFDLIMQNATDPVMQVFEDKSIAVRFTAGREDLGFDLENRTNGIIEILWDDIIFEDVNGQRHAMFHAGADYVTADGPQQPGVVSPGKRLQGSMIPKDHIAPCESEPQKWCVSPLLLPKGVGETEPKSLSALVVGKECSLVLPLMVRGQREVYFFKFKVAAIPGPGGRGPVTAHGEKESIQPIK